MKVRAIVTAPPHAAFLPEIAAHPRVCGLRLNTVMPVAPPPDDPDADPIGAALDRLSGLGQPLWVDLKGRQLRVVEAAVPPFTAVRVSHRIRVPLPCDVFFRDGKDHARLIALDGDRLILEAGPRRVIGPGESINVPHPDLQIEGTLTATDRAYLAAMRARGLDRVMLSFVERPEDPAEVRALLPGAQLALKIESQRGLSLARRHGAGLGRLMTARGDLYVEVVRPHRILGAMRQIVQADPDAILASRIFSGLAWDAVPRCAELTDVAFAIGLGYRTFMLGDHVSLKRDSALEALELLGAVAQQMDPTF